MTLRLGYDSDNIDDIPDNAQIVFFYNDDEPGTPTATQLERFQGRILVPITRKPGVKSKVGDVEAGALTVEQAVQEFDAGNIDSLYFNLNTWPSVQTAMGGRTYGKWVAYYPGTVSPTSAEYPDHNGGLGEFDAWQYASPSQGVPGHYDVSYVSESWPVPNPTPSSVQTEGTPTVSDTVQNPPVVADPTDAPLEAADDKVVLQAPIVDAVAINENQGYMVAADGGVFAWGGAPMYGSMAGVKLAHAVCSIVVNGTQGYTLIAEDGGSFSERDGKPFGPNPPHVPAV